MGAADHIRSTAAWLPRQELGAEKPRSRQRRLRPPKRDRPRFPFLSFFSSSPLPLLSVLFSLFHTPTLPFSSARSAHSFRLLLSVSSIFSRHLTLFSFSLVNISLTSSFVQGPVRVLGLGIQPLSSQFQLSHLRFLLHSYSRTRRFPVSRRATMSASGDDTPLIKSNGKPGELLSVTPVIPSVLRSPRKLASFSHYTQPRSISPRHPLHSLAFSIESLFLC